MFQRKCLVALFIAASSLPSMAQQTIRTRQNLEAVLGFENGTPGAFPVGWAGGIAGAAGPGVVIDDKIAQSGKNSARIDRDATSPSTFTWLYTTIPLDFAGQTVEWRGYIKTEDVNGFAAILFREDTNTVASIQFNTTQSLAFRGTNDWKRFSITLPVDREATIMTLAVILGGTGKAWFDSLEFLVDGKPAAQAPNRSLGPLDTDKEFTQGSKISLTTLTDLQVKNLSTLGRVWGFVKYHHPAVTSGTRHWDFDLFRVLPQVLAATDTASANKAISTWIAAIGAVPNCTLCATLSLADVHIRPRNNWINDESLLGAELSQTLRNIHRNRSIIRAAQVHVNLAPGVHNPIFENEFVYPTATYPDAGFQLLALYRYWNMVEYFYPNREVMSDDPSAATTYWPKVLEDSIRGITLAKTAVTYQQELMKFIAKINDTHANLWTSIAARPPIGPCQFPVDVRFVEGKPIVLRHISPTAGPASGLLPGDLIDQLDGVPVDELVASWRPIYADSNEAARLRDMGNYLTRGACGAAKAVVRRGTEVLAIQPTRVALNTLNFSASSTHDRPGATFQKLSDDVAYLKLSSVQVSQSAAYIRSAAGTKGLIIDIRNYPSEFVVFSLGSLLVSQPTDFVRFTEGDLTNPGAFHWTPALPIFPAEPHYSGKVVILVDEVTQSQAEYTTMAFRKAPGAIVIGSTTAGADGNVSTIALPGGYSSYISGIGIFYPDFSPTQRIGIIPDIVVTPTIAGIRAGRDELLEEAMRQITK